MCVEVNKNISFAAFDIRSWTLEEVGHWLESLSLGEYLQSFYSHDITGAELLNLERRDLKVGRKLIYF